MPRKPEPLLDADTLATLAFVSAAWGRDPDVVVRDLLTAAKRRIEARRGGNGLAVCATGLAIEDTADA